MKNETSFETALAELESSVKKIESGELSLDESIVVFEESVRLIGICNKKIEEAEGRVRILTEQNDGSVTDAPFVSFADEN
jgi:exodeoxyribonuclease VII small subunit